MVSSPRISIALEMLKSLSLSLSLSESLPGMSYIYVVVYYCRTYVKAVRGGWSEEGGLRDVCYEMLRAAACQCVDDQSDHHAPMYVVVYYCRT